MSEKKSKKVNLKKNNKEIAEGAQPWIERGNTFL
jgi:hypothetical protein